MIDVIERDFEELVRKEADQHVRGLFSSTSNPVALLEAEEENGFAVEYVNPAFEAFFEMPATSLEGRSFVGLLLPHQSARITRACTDCLAEARSTRDEGELTFPTGSKYVRTVVVPMLNASGKPYQLLIVMHDMTRQKQIEAQLQQSEERYRLLVQLSPNLIAAETKGIITFINDAGARVLGAASAAGIIGKTVYEFIPPENHEEVRRWITRSPLDDRQVCEHPVRAIRMDGLPVDFEVSAVPMPGQEETSMILFAIDVTERNRADRELRSSRDQLRLLAARQESIREDERTRIAREIHDELGQQMTGIKMNLSWLAKKISREKPILEAIAQIRGSVDAAMQSIRRIVSELRPHVLDELGLAAAIEWQAKKFEQQSGVPCRINATDRLALLDAPQSTALFRVLQESLTNVARHANASDVSVCLSHEQDAIVLKVEDDGVGIDGRAVSAPTSLGILGMKERVTHLGGSISVSRVNGHGTRVVARFPQQTP